MNANHALSQLSYSPKITLLPEQNWLARIVLIKADSEEVYTRTRRGLQHRVTQVWWVWVDLNHRPHPYQGCALTN